MKLYVANLAVINRELEYTDEKNYITRRMNDLESNVYDTEGNLIVRLSSRTTEIYTLNEEIELIVKKNLNGSVTDVISGINLPVLSDKSETDEHIINLSKPNERVYAKVYSDFTNDYINKKLSEQTISGIKKQREMICKILDHEEPYKKEHLNNKQLVKRINKYRKQGYDRD